jgi:hypothetical protein
MRIVGEELATSNDEHVMNLGRPRLCKLAIGQSLLPSSVFLTNDTRSATIYPTLDWPKWFCEFKLDGEFRSHTTQFYEHWHFPNHLERLHHRFTKCNLYQWIHLVEMYTVNQLS